MISSNATRGRCAPSVTFTVTGSIFSRSVPAYPPGPKLEAPPAISTPLPSVRAA